MNKALALVQTGPKQLEFKELDLPELEPGAVLVRVEANGLCHSDVEAYDGDEPASGNVPTNYPRILGHEVVGTIEAMGQLTSSREGFRVGDRVGINPFNSCGTCEFCIADKPGHCTGWGVENNILGYIPTTFGPGLWGGYATHTYVHPNTALYRFPASVDPYDATLWNPFAGAFQWGVMDTNLVAGEKVAILGCGQRGLAMTAAVKSAGASTVLTTGLTRDRHKLDLSREFGADVTVDIEQENLVDVADRVTDGIGFDVVIDTSPLATQPILDAIRIARPGGRLAVVGMKLRNIPEFPIDQVTFKSLRILGCFGQGHDAYSRAAEFVSTTDLPLHKMRTHVFGFDRLDEAIALVRGERPEEKSINVVVTPTRSGGSN